MVSQLAAQFPGSVWDSVPKGSFNFGGGGVGEWGSICGGPNAGAALLTQVMGSKAAADPFVNEYLRWYETAAFPSNAAYEDWQAHTAQWTPFNGGNTNNNIINGAPKSAAHSLLCHASYSRWINMAKKDATYWAKATAAPNTATPNKDRCAKLVYDCLIKLVTLINDWKAGTTPAGLLDPSARATGCMTPTCHSDTSSAVVRTKGRMQCTDSCHE